MCANSAPLLANSPLKAELQLKAQSPVKPPKKSTISGLLACISALLFCHHSYSVYRLVMMLTTLIN